MKIKSCYSLFVLLFLLLGIFCISCAPKITKPSTFPQNINGKNEPTEIEKLAKESFKFYYQGQFTEAVTKLETAIQIIPQEPSSSFISLYTLLEFFQDKSANIGKANLTSATLQDLFQKIKSDTHESYALALRLIQFAQQLKPIDRIQFWQRLRPIVSASHGKPGEAGALWQIAEAYIAINDYSKAYEYGTKGLKLARESNVTAVEVNTSLVISRSLMGLGRIREAEDILREILPKTKGDPFLKANTLAQSAMIHGMLGHKEQTVTFLQEAISIAQSSGLTYYEPILRFGLGMAYLQIGKKENGKQEFMNALGLSEKLGDKFQLASLEISIANNFLGVDLFEEAYHDAMHAADSYKELGMRIEEARSLRIAGQSLAELDKLDDALRILKKAVDIQVEEKNLNEAVNTFMLMNKLLKQMGRIEDLKRNLLAGLDANAAFFGDKKGEAYIRNELGDVYKELGSFLEALVEYMQAFKLYEQLSDKKLQIITLLKQASVFAYLNDQDKRIQLLGVAAQIWADLNDPEVQVLILNDQAKAFQDFGRTVDALDIHLEALEISRQIGKKYEIFQLISISDFFMDWMGEYTRALNYLEEALTLAKEIGDRESESNILSGIGKVYLRMGRFEDAVRLSRDALTIIRAIKAEKLTYETLALEYLGLGLINQGLYDSAFEVYQEWLQIALKSGSLSQMQKAYSNLGYVYLKLGNYEEAVKASKMAIEQTENMRNRIIEEHRAGFFATSLSPYDNLVEALYQLYLVKGPEKGHLAEEGLDFAEASKARTWKEHFSESRLRFIQESIPLEVRNEESNLLNEMKTSYLAYIKAFHGYNVPDTKLNDEKNAYEAVHKKWTVFVEEVRRQYPKYAALQYPEPVHLGELRIRDEESLVVYKVGIDWTYAWVIRRIEGQNKIIKFTRLPIRTDHIIKLTGEFLKPFRKVKYEEFKPKVAAELFRAILLPLIEGVKSKHLVIVPDGILNVVPFEALVIEQVSDKGLQTPLFLQDKFLISYYPSTTILTFNRQTVPLTLPPKDSMLAVGDPVYGMDDDRLTKSQVSMVLEHEPKQQSFIVTRRGKAREGAQERGYSFARLRWSGVEVSKINEVLRNRPGSRDLLIGSEATESHVKSRDLTQYQYLHFAVHGILAYDIPYLKEPALVLAIDSESNEVGFLTLSEIYGLKLNADLVTLSACGTGLGQRIPGEGVIGLSRAFIDAGSRAVLVSLWQVDDYSIALFMEEFYQLLGQGVSKVEALAKAKEYLRQKGYENPYFWAPFILIGD